MNQFLKSQNNPNRKILKIFDPTLNRILNPDLSPNEISLLGLNKSITGLNKILNSKNRFTQFYGFYLFIIGEIFDLLDGIRARHIVISSEVEKSSSKNKSFQFILNTKYSILNTANIRGYLLDGFSDRVKEFYYFYKKYFLCHPELVEGSRLKDYSSSKRSKSKSKFSTSSNNRFYDSALSCILPSIARATNELLDQTVSEKDEKGGSMIDRVKLIFKSVFFYILGFKNFSLYIDQQIYQKNLATFHNRISKIDFNQLENLRENRLNDFQKKALIRLAFYLQIYREELNILKIKNKIDQINKLSKLEIINSVDLENEEELFKIFNDILVAK